MATFIKAVLPSGRGLWLEKLDTRQYRAVNKRVAMKLGDGATSFQMSDCLGHEMLLASLRGVTEATIPVVLDKDEQPDIDAMLATVAEDKFWTKPTFENLITEGPLELESLFSEPTDYLVATQLAVGETLGGGGAFQGKIKREFVGR